VTVGTRALRDCKAFRIQAADTNKFVLLVDPAADETGFVAVIEIFDVGGRTPANIHERADELFYVLHGEGVIIYHHRRAALRQGAWFLVRAGEEHVVENTGSGRLYCLTTMVPDESFAAAIRNGVADRLDEEDLRVLEGT
jgi:mannose-6-phosphate isomerase-like protein (cupin superfamily)